MAGYFENATLGYTGVNLKDKAATTEFFIGKNVSKNTNTYASANDAGGIDWGTDAGTFNLKINFDIQLIKKVKLEEGADTDVITFKIYSSKDDKTFTELGSYSITLGSLNSAKRKNNIVFSALPTMGRYFCMGITLPKNGTEGMIVVSCNPQGY